MTIFYHFPLFLFNATIKIMFVKGDYIKHPNKREWGVGVIRQVLSDNKLKVFFVNAGDRLLSTVHADLIKVSNSDINEGDSIILKENLNRLTEEEFILRAISVLGESSRSKGIHVVYSGFNEAFRKYFNGADPKRATTRLEFEGKINIVPVKGGVMLFLNEEAPLMSSDFTESIANTVPNISEHKDSVQYIDSSNASDTSLPEDKLVVEKPKLENRSESEDIETDDVCEKCGSPMIISWDERGLYMKCSASDECNNMKEYIDSTDRLYDKEFEEETDEIINNNIVDEFYDKHNMDSQERISPEGLISSIITSSNFQETAQKNRAEQYVQEDILYDDLFYKRAFKAASIIRDKWDILLDFKISKKAGRFNIKVASDPDRHQVIHFSQQKHYRTGEKYMRLMSIIAPSDDNSYRMLLKDNAGDDSVWACIVNHLNEEYFALKSSVNYRDLNAKIIADLVCHLARRADYLEDLLTGEDIE